MSFNVSRSRTPMNWNRMSDFRGLMSANLFECISECASSSYGPSTKDNGVYVGIREVDKTCEEQKHGPVAPSLSQYFSSQSFSFGPGDPVDEYISYSSINAHDTSSFQVNVDKQDCEHSGTFSEELRGSYCRTCICHDTSVRNYHDSSLKSCCEYNGTARIHESNGTARVYGPTNSLSGNALTRRAAADQTEVKYEDIKALPNDAIPCSLGFDLSFEMSSQESFSDEDYYPNILPQALPEILEPFQSMSFLSPPVSLTALAVNSQTTKPILKKVSKYDDQLKETCVKDTELTSRARSKNSFFAKKETSEFRAKPRLRRSVSFANTLMRQGTQGGSGKLSLAKDTSDSDDGESYDDWIPHFDHDDDDDDDNNDNSDEETTLKRPITDDEDFSTEEHTDVPCTSSSPIDFSEPENDALSIFDGPNTIKAYYAAYLCCASEDLEHFGIAFHELLENWGFRIFLPDRDLVLKGCNFNNMSRALEERCNGKIIVILSVNYEKSEECAFITYFSKVLDPDARKRNIIPVQIDKKVNITNVLKGLSIIRYNHDYKCGWLKQKLVDAIAA